MTIPVACGELEDFLCLLDSEVAGCIENPQQRNAEVAGAAGATALQTLEDRGEILLAIKADANRNIDLGVQYGFFLEPLHQAIGNQFVVFGGAQLRAHRLECHQETLEVAVVVERLNLGKSRVVAVQLTEFQERGRLDRALKVQMQLRLRQLTDKSIGRAQRHGSHPLDCRFLTKDLRGNGDLAGEDFSATIGCFSDHGVEIS